jgi:Amt family ammonium transporter
MSRVGRLGAICALACLTTFGVAQAAAPEPTTAHVKQMLDFVWVLLCAGLVFTMQLGFLLLEAGMVRSKNSINVALKNFFDFMFSTVVFAAFGFMFAFAASSHWLPVGWDPKLLMVGPHDPWIYTFFVFQVMFCGTAATIVSGAVAERMKLSAYIVCSIAIGGILYPIFVHWAWGAALGARSGAFLANMGFVDFAGSTVVHATGAWISLAACLVLGPRLGRFGPDGKPRRIAGHSPVLATAGAMMLFFGWIGFNGGSTLAASPDIAHIVLNTVLAGSAGAVLAYFLGRRRDGVITPENAINGLLGGLVAITAGCAVLEPWSATLIGGLGGLVAVAANAFIEERCRIDDTVGAIGVHGAAGVLGTVGLALLAPVANLPTHDRLVQLGVQCLGSAVNFVWAFGLGWIFFALMDRTMKIRVIAEAEQMGLNEAEHATRLGIGHVEEAFGQLVQGTMDLGTRMVVEPGDEAERLSHIFNRLMDNLEQEEIARSQANEVQRSAQEADRLAALADATFEALCVFAQGRILDGNAALATLLGLPLEALRGRPLSDFMAAPELEVIEAGSFVQSNLQHEMNILGADGHTIPVEVRGRDVVYGATQARVLAFFDMRERKEAEAKIRYLAQHEPLTLLPNRALFNEQLERMCRTATTSLMSAVLLVDLDHFKDINDLHGHAAGDEVLKATADRLRAHCRRDDMVARLGGDEFGVLQLRMQFRNQATDLAHRLVQELSRPIILSNGATVRVGASIGLAICPRDGDSAAQLASRADTALYHVKNGGRNSWAAYEEGMDAELREQQRLQADIDRALDENEFELYFQPRLSLATRRACGHEALIRWRHPERGLVPPSAFIGAAENSGKIVQIGEWVLREACRIAAARPELGRVSVNASPVQLRESHFPDIVYDALQASGLNPARLEIEITESVLMDDDQRATGILKSLKRLGVAIALDDFGTGYSSLSYLSRFPFDVIKIDRSFVKDIGETPNNVPIVETIIRLGRALKLTIVAEGVETPAELRFLADLGCDEVQGFLMGRPAPAGDLAVRTPAVVLDTLAGTIVEAAAEAETVAVAPAAAQPPPATPVPATPVPAQAVVTPPALAPLPMPVVVAARVQPYALPERALAEPASSQERAVLALQQRLDRILANADDTEDAPAPRIRAAE